MGSPLPRQGPHDLTVGKKVKTIFTLFIFTCTQYWIISFHASEGPPIQNEQMWAASCSQKMKPSLKLVVSSHHNGVWIFFSPVSRRLDCFPPVYREAGCHTGFHSAGSQSVAPLCRTTFGGTFGKKDEPDHLLFCKQASNITCFSMVSHQSFYLVIKYIGTIQKLKGWLRL